MDVREKLVDVFDKIGCEKLEKAAYSQSDFERLVSDLIAHGVTVYECKVGDIIYEADSEHGVINHDVYEVCIVFKTTAKDDKGNEWDDYWTSEDIGNAFKTRNEAELKLLEVLQKG